MSSIATLFALFSLCLCQYYVSTLAGSGESQYADGQDIHASFSHPCGVAVDSIGNVYVGDANNYLIRKINSTGFTSTIAGNGQSGYLDGQSVNASFSYLADIAVDSSGNILVVDIYNNLIRMVNTTGYVSTLAGNGTTSYSDGQGKYASFNSPLGIAIGLSGNIIVTDVNRIRRINSTGYVSTIAGSDDYGFTDGQDVNASFNIPIGVGADSFGNIFVVDYTTSRIRKVNATGYVSTIAGNGSFSFSDGHGIEATFNSPIGITVDSIGNLYVADSENQRIRKIDPTGYVTTIAGTGASGANDGEASTATFYSPQRIAINGNGTLFVADLANNKIRKIYHSSFTLSSSGLASSATVALSPTNTFSSAIPTGLFSIETETTSTVILSSTLKSKPISNILATYLRPEFTYSALVGMLLVAVIFTFLVMRKRKPKVLGRRERFIRNMEIQRKLELRQRQQSLSKNQKKGRK